MCGLVVTSVINGITNFFASSDHCESAGKNVLQLYMVKYKQRSNVLLVGLLNSLLWQQISIPEIYSYLMMSIVCEAGDLIMIS